MCPDGSLGCLVPSCPQKPGLGWVAEGTSGRARAPSLEKEDQQQPEGAEATNRHPREMPPQPRVGDAWGRGHSQHQRQRGSEQQNTVSLSPGGRRSEPGKREPPGATLPGRLPLGPGSAPRLHSVRGAHALWRHFPKSPSPGSTTSCWGTGGPFLAAPPSHCFPAWHLSFSCPSF